MLIFIKTPHPYPPVGQRYASAGQVPSPEALTFFEGFSLWEKRFLLEQALRWEKGWGT